MNLPVLKKGDKGGPVKSLQQLLMAKGYKMKSKGKTYKDDGDFGAATENAVNAYKKAKKLPTNGIVDDETWAKLLGVK